jgi:hypothetical protein
MSVSQRPAMLCYCKIVGDKIVFCALHKKAETLLVVCDYLHKFFLRVKMGETKDEIL